MCLWGPLQAHNSYCALLHYCLSRNQYMLRRSEDGPLRMDFAFPHKIIHMKYLWKCIICVPSQNNKYLLSVYFAFPHKIIHMESMRRPRLKVLTGLEYHLPLNRPHRPKYRTLVCTPLHTRTLHGTKLPANFFANCQNFSANCKNFFANFENPIVFSF